MAGVSRTLLLLSGCAALCVAQNDGCGPRVRKAYSSLTCSERQLYADAVATLVRDQRETYLRIVETHQRQEQYAHQTSAFLPWHRQYVLQYENMLRSLPGFECVTVPYWDWERDAGSEERQAASAPLKNRTFGNLVNHPQGQTQCVDNGIAAGWTMRNGACLQRRRSSQGFTGEAALMEIITSHRNFRAFSVRLEGAPHAAPHIYIGGQMATMRSPADPVFFMHHANVDRLWALWQDYHEHDKVDKSALQDGIHYEAESRRWWSSIPDSDFDLDATMPYAYDRDGSALPELAEPVTVRDMWSLSALPNGVTYTYGPDSLAAQLAGTDAETGTTEVEWVWAQPQATPYRTCCGDGTRDAGEQCDDGNRVNADSCSNTCQFVGATRDARTASVAGAGAGAGSSRPHHVQFSNPLVQAKHDELVAGPTQLSKRELLRELALYECSLLGESRAAPSPEWLRMVGASRPDMYDQCKVL
eukprot:TRINITY_DN14_c0_g1_i15.p2 TRINITY_DN14_c0_g1~~TRINITY_DN14_c0_g1_i15.p2  ORF type:complete len:473 (+),score=175.38 TRINITY_DN14_c0_g1_i15:58-1476(+)